MYVRRLSVAQVFDFENEIVQSFQYTTTSPTMTEFFIRKEFLDCDKNMAALFKTGELIMAFRSPWLSVFLL